MTKNRFVHILSGAPQEVLEHHGGYEGENQGFRTLPADGTVSYQPITEKTHTGQHHLNGIYRRKVGKDRMRWHRVAGKGRTN